jgi:hypothetical protein
VLDVGVGVILLFIWLWWIILTILQHFRSY